MITITSEVSKEDLISSIYDAISHEDLPEFLSQIEEEYQDVDVFEAVTLYFMEKYHKFYEEYLKEDDSYRSLEELTKVAKQ